VQEKAQMRIPILDLSVQHQKIRDELEAAVAGVLNSQKFIVVETIASFYREAGD